MILLPDRTITRPTDVRDGVWEEHRIPAVKPAPRDIVEETSMDSFPASDAPSWSLVSIGPPAPSAGAEAEEPAELSALTGNSGVHD